MMQDDFLIIMISFLYMQNVKKYGSRIVYHELMK